jgi:peptidoglycan-associated lipoprotein
MKRYSIFFAAGIIGIFFFFYGCAPKTVPLTHPVSPSEMSPSQKDTLTGKDGKTKAGGITEEDLARAEALRKKRLAEEAAKESSMKDIFFDFDSYVIKPSDTATLKEIGNWLRRNKDIKVAIEGHCDERGTAEYNLALGQKRAEAVKEYLIKAGVEQSRIKTISYGKELPFDSGHSEDAWARNRRAHFKIDRKG